MHCNATYIHLLSTYVSEASSHIIVQVVSGEHLGTINTLLFYLYSVITKYI